MGADCHCCVPRKRAPRLRKKDAITSQNDSQPDLAEPIPSSSTSLPKAPSHILARLAELRPVLPRPSSRGRSSSGPHDPSSSNAHGHPRIYEHSHFSPYGRAYNVNHDPFDNVATQKEAGLSQNSFPISSVPTFPTEEQAFRDQLRALEAATRPTWMPPSGTEGSMPSFPSTCGCGDNCRCPGCMQHNPGAAPTSSAFSSCMNPSTCTNCLDCTILSLPASLPPDTALSIYDAYQTDSIDDWIREVSSLPRVPPSETSIPPDSNLVDRDQSQWDGYMASVAEPQPTDEAFGYSVKPCCGVLCKCTPETCECDLEDESGYDCRREMLLPTFSTRTYTEDQVFQQLDNREAMSFEATRGRAGSDAYLDGGSEQGGGPYSFSEPSRSRSSSTSTSSSHSQPTHRHPAQSQTQQNPFTTQPLSQDFSYPWQPPGRVVRGTFYAGQSSISSPNLALRAQTEANNSWSRGSSPSSVSSVPSAPGSRNGHGNAPYALSNPDSDGYGSADDRMHWRD
ncbi:hypothetical protein H0H87_000642 [Tephrocybe sp. NHM501043]|nr:hypothetical protein H0H87_000642 [Tephrocybe sp. NHM501043]